jgi:hypothetical protein
VTLAVRDTLPFTMLRQRFATRLNELVASIEKLRATKPVIDVN